MKKKIYVVSVFLIIFTTVITSVIFQGDRKIEDFHEAQEEIVFLESILLNKNIKYKDREMLNKILEDYTVVLNAKMDIRYEDGSKITLNDDEREVIYEKDVKSENGYINGITIYLYEEAMSGDYIRSLLSAIIISIIIALFFINRFVKDDTEVYDNLILGIQKNIDGEYNKLDLKRKDEKFFTLEKKFNLMNKKLYDTVEESKELNIKLKSIISSMTEGVLALDTDGNIILINSFAEYILGLDKDKNNFADIDIMKKDYLIALMDGKYEANYLELELDYPISKKIRITTNPIKYYRYSNKKLGNLFIFEDITQIEKLETIRSDFVANVSHELKTPLTSVLGFVETLKLGAIDDRETAIRFIDIMEDEVRRMNTLIDDLLLLSEIESENIDLSMETIDLSELIDNVFLTMEGFLEEENISLEKNIKSNELLVFTNENYMRQLIINLVGNSIKYNRTGGFVCVTCSKNSGYLYIDILDNGIGIGDEDRKRIFERFYRVDKSRSTKIDGTGLGLSIVKHIVSIFNGSLFIESKIDRGTLITVKLPIE